MASIARKHILLVSAIIMCAALSFVCAQSAYAADRTELSRNYQSAVINYENVAVAQQRNNEDIATMEANIEQTQARIDRTREQLGNTAVDLYKETRRGTGMLDYVLSSMTFHEAVTRFDTYERVEKHYRNVIGQLAEEEAQLNEELATLEERKSQLEDELEQARLAIEYAAEALRKSSHEDGADYHQVQGVSNNCGATAFIVGVNILLGEDRFIDNVAVWEGPGFNRNSTSDLAYRGGVWLHANGLSAQLSIETVPGDIHTTEDMRAHLEEGHVIVTSSGAGSVWQRADGTEAPPGTFPDGHWIVFYHYEDGIYYANDSAVDATQGAGCPYTEEQMQQWLDGRSNHFATVIKTI